MSNLLQNAQQAADDFASIKSAIEARGVSIPDGTYTSEYSAKILSIPGIIPSGTISITENGSDIDVALYASANVNVIDPAALLNNEFEKTLEGSDSSSYEAENTLSQNINQAISDLSSIKTAIGNKGVTVPSGTPSSDYAGLIDDIPSGDDSQLLGLIGRTATHIDIPQGVTSIGLYAISYCDSLTSITIPDSVTSIGDYAFLYCSSLASITIPSGVMSIGQSAFNGCRSFTSITIPNGVTTISNRLFSGCSRLESITTGNNITQIGEMAFSSCQSLTSFTIPDSVTRISGYVFSNCLRLASITIPNSVTSIGAQVFYGCSALTNVTIKNGFNCNGLDLSSSTLYSAETIVSWLNALADRTGETAYTLTIGSTNLNKLTAEQIAITTNKNWNLA